MKPTRLHKKRVLVKCGFRQKGTGREPHEKWVLEIDGRAVLQTSVPRHTEITGPTFLKILKQQLFLRREEYEEIFSCRERLPYYLQILTKNGLI